MKLQKLFKDNGELLDELSEKGLVYAGCGGGSDERYRLTSKGKLIFLKLCE